MLTLLFDLDGTLIDSAPDLCSALNATLAELGLDSVTEGETRDMTGNGARRLVERAIACKGALVSPEELEGAYRLFLELYDASCCEGTEPYSGVMDVLPKLYDRAGPLGLCTNKPIAPTRRILEHLGMARYFGAVFGGDSVPHKKPNPAMLDACRQELGRDRASVVFVGDSGVDEAAARSFGSAFVGVTYGYGAGALSEQALKVDFFPRLLDVFGDLELKKLRV